MDIYIVCEVNTWPFRRDDDFILENALFGAVELVKKCSEYSEIFRIWNKVRQSRNFSCLMAVNLENMS